MKKHLMLAIVAGWLTTAIAQRNVILIIADDLGTDYCGFYEDAADTARMPNIRSLLSRGIRFDNAWATPLCSPTRAGMLTGRYSFRHGVGAALAGPSYPQLDTAEITIPKLLKTLSTTPYATANIGKWHLNQRTPQNLNFPNAFGYDLYAGNFLGALPDYYEWEKITNGTAATVTRYATTETVDDAINWLDEQDGSQSFFLWMAFNAAHTPFHKPPDTLHSVPNLTGTTPHIMQNPKLYFKAMLEAMDTETGRLFDWLNDHNLMDQTDIIFIGDNGNTGRVSQIADTSHAKGTLYEYGVHVPFVIAGPSVVAPGRSSDALVNTHDLFATILELAGVDNWATAIPPDRPVDAQSLLPIIENQATEVRNWVFTEQFNPQTKPQDGKAMRNHGYKLIHFDDGHQELYHLTADPLEQTDLLPATLNEEAHDNYTYLCSEMEALTGLNICDPTISSVEIATGNTVRVFPNPTTGIVYIKCEPSPMPPTLLLISDMYGRLIARHNFPGTQTPIDLSEAPAGIYTIYTLYDTQVFTEKIRVVR